jgi:carboxyl-terminal processing protease
VFIEPAAREVERERLQGTFGGIGAYITRSEDTGEVILEPIPGNPAEAAGILTGDILLAVDGSPISAEMTVPEIIDLVKGEKGTTVILTVRHPGAAEPVDISVVRDDILLPSVAYRLLEQDATIGYIQLSRFSGESSTEVGVALQSLQAQGATQFILDLRQNGGGLRDAAVEVVDHFLADGPVLILESQEEGERIFNATAETIALNEPLVVLVDGGTASASEIVAGALQDRGRAALIGNSPTFGKGSVQLVFDLSDGSSVHVTSARWLTPNRHQIDQSGLQPDVLVEVTQDDIDNGRDPVLDRAVTYLQEATP